MLSFSGRITPPMFAVFSIPFVVLNANSCCVIVRSLSHVRICHTIREKVTQQLGLNAAYVTLARMFYSSSVQNFAKVAAD